MNRYPIDATLSDRAFHLLKNQLPNSGPRVIRGPFATVSTITASDERADALFSTFFPIMETMEGSAAAHVAILYGIPFLEIRSASNWVGKRDRNAWDLPLAFRNCSTAVNILIENIKELM
jgi:futalosine hydrolase